MAKYIDDNGLLYLWQKIKALVSGSISEASAEILATSDPKASGTAAVGTSTKAAREDHVHPEQTSVTGNAGTATKLQNKTAIDGVNFDGSEDIVHFGTCSTVAATAEKVVACPGFVLNAGAMITVLFNVTNSAASPTLNVNGTGAKAIQYRGAAITKGYLAAKHIYSFVYSGSVWMLIGDVDTDTTYSAATTTKAGLMSAEDKAKLNGMDDAISTAISDALEGITGISYSVVDTLPGVGEPGVIYLVSNSGTGSNSYDEYIYVSGKFEKIGSTDVDLSGYWSKTELVAIQNSEIDEIVDSE